MTFKACLHAIEHWAPDMFLLENVEMSEDPDSGEGNLDLVVRALKHAGYQVEVYRILSSDYGLPTRRSRLYLGGFHLTKQDGASFSLVSKFLELFKLKSQPPDTC